MLSRRIFLPLPVLLFLLLVLTAPADAQSVNIAGDANGDTAVNVQDVQVIINQALATSPPTPAGDPNRDGTVNVQDVQLTINLALGQFVVAAVDPAIAPVTATIRLEGGGFNANAGANTVTIGGVAATVVQAFTEGGRVVALDVIVPVGAANGAITVDNGLGGSAAPPSTAFTLQPNAPPSVATNTGVSCDEGGSATITSGEFDVTDLDNTAAELTLAVQTLPANGTLTRGGAPVSVGDMLSLADFAMQGFSYSHDGGESSADQLVVNVADPLGASTGATAIAITVSPVNDAPVVTAPATLMVDEDLDLDVSGVSLADPDAGSADVELSLSVSDATLTLDAAVSGGLVAGQISGNGSGAVTVTAPLAALNATLAATGGLVLRGSTNFSGAVSLMLSLSDLGNTGAGGALTGGATVAITINPANDIPTLAVDNVLTLNEGETQSYDATHTRFDDVEDASAALTLMLVSAPGNGTLLVSGSPVPAGGSFSQDDLIQGNVSYMHDGSETTSDSFVLRAMDSGGAASADATRTVTVSPVNDAPIITAPAMAMVDEDLDLDVSGVSLADPDAGGADVELSLSVSDATLNLDTGVSGGLVAGQISGNGSGAVTVTAPLAAMNATLAATGGLVLRGSTNFSGAVSLMLSLSDLGNTGAGGALTGGATVAITINPANDIPTLAVDNVLTLNEGETQSYDATHTRFDDVEDASAALTLMLVSAPGNGTLLVSGSPVPAGGSFSQDDLIQGNVSYMHDGSETTSDSFVLRATDTGGAVSADTIRQVTVLPVNDPPSLTGPAMVTVDEDTDIFVTGISGADPDAGASEVGLRIQASGTTLTLSTSVAGGLVAGQISANGTDRVIIAAPLAAINATLADPAGLTLRGSQDFDGSTTLILSLNDNGATGSGGGRLAGMNIPVTVNPINDPPTFENVGPLAVNEGELLVISPSQVSVRDPEEGSADLMITLESLPTNGFLSTGTGIPFTVGHSFEFRAILQGNIRFVHDGSETTSDSFELSVVDPEGLTANATIPVTVSPVNDAPSVTAPATAMVDEDLDLDVSGVSLADPDAGSADVELSLSVSDATLTLDTAVSGGLVAGQISGNGSGAVTATAPLAALNATLSATGGLVLRGAANFSGAVSLMLSLNDQGSSGAGGALTGGATVAVTINPVNDIPTLAVDSALTLNEGDTQSFNATHTRFDDVEDASADLTLMLVSAPGNGTLLVSGTPVTAGQTFSQNELIQGNVTYMHDGSETTTDSFVLRAMDSGGAVSADATRTVNVLPVNDAPSVTAPASVTVDEDTDIVVTGVSLADPDSGANDVRVVLDGDTTRLTVSAAVSGGLVAGQIAANGTDRVTVTASLAAINTTLADPAGLTLRGVSNFAGSTSLLISINDLGSTGSGGSLTANATVAVTVNPINDPPTFTINGPLALDEGATFSIRQGSVTAGDVEDADANLILTLESTPSSGSVARNGTPLPAGQTFEFRDILQGNITYVHDGSETTSDSFELSVVDSEGVTADATIPITISPVNDAPTVTAPGTASVDEDSELSVTGLSLADPDAGGAAVILTLGAPGAALQLSTTVPGGLTGFQIVGNGSSTVGATAPIAAINATLAAAGGLRLTPAADFNGTLTFTASADDQGASGSGGAQTGSATTTVTVNPVNDPPTLDAIADRDVFADGQPAMLTLTGLTAGPSDESTQSLTVTAVSSDQSLVMNSSISVTGSGSSRTLTFTPELLQLGMTTLTVTVMDSGGTGSGGQDMTSRTVTLTLVQPAPVVTAVTPSIGAPAGGEFVTITGSFFVAGQSVQLGGQSLRDIIVVDASTVIGRTPPAAAGQAGASVDVSVGSGILASGFSYNGDAGAPSVVTSFPANFATNVPANSATAFLFDEPLDPASVLDPNGSTTGSSTGIFASGLQTGTARLSEDGRWVVVRSAQNYTVGNSNQIFVLLWAGSPTLTDLAGNAFTINTSRDTTIGGRTAEFSIIQTGGVIAAETTAPTLTAADPASGSSNLGVTGAIRLTFSEELDPSSLRSVTNPTVTLTAGGSAVALEVVVGSDLRSVTLTPLQPLPFAASLSLTLTTGITDLRGNAFAGQTLSFTTRSDPGALTLDSVSPSSVPLDGGVAVRLRGFGFRPGDGLTVDGQACTDVRYISREEMTAVVPARSSPGSVDIALVRASGSTTIGSLTYTATAPADRPPEILFEFPPAFGQGGNNPIPQNSDIVLVLSEPIDPATLETRAFDVFTLFPHPFTVAFADSSNRVIVVSSADFAASPVDLIVYRDRSTGEGLRDLAGNRLNSLQATDARFVVDTPDPGVSFQWDRAAADTTAPTLTSSSPGSGGTIAATASTIVLEFNEAMHPTFANMLTVTDGAGAVPVTIELDLETLRTITLRLGRSLSGTVTVDTSGLRDLASQMFGTASLSFTVATDTTAPTITQMTLDAIPDHLNGSGPAGGTLQAPPSGFTLDLSFTDDGGSGVSAAASSLSVTANVAAGPVAAGQNIVPQLPLGHLVVEANRATLLWPANLELAIGSVTLTATVTDAAGNNASESFSFTTIAATAARTVIDSDEVWVLVMDRDFDNYSPDFANYSLPLPGATQTAVNANGTFDLDEDLTSYGLASAAGNASVNGGALSMNQAARNWFVNRVVFHTARFFGQDVEFTDGNANPGFAGFIDLMPARTAAGTNIRFVAMTSDPGSGFNRMAFGGQVFPPQTIGRANFDVRNTTQGHDNGASTSALTLGIFPGNVLGNHFDGAAPAVVSRFRSTFDPVTPYSGGGSNNTGTPLGMDASDPVVLAPTADPASFTAAQRTRWQVLLRALDDAALHAAATNAHEIGHSLGLIIDGDPPVGLFGGDAVFGTSTSGHVDLIDFFSRGGSNIMAPGATFESKVSKGTRFNRLAEAYLRNRILTGS